MRTEATGMKATRTAMAVAVACACVGTLGLVLGAMRDPGRAMFAYLTAYNDVMSVVLGALLFLMIGHAMNAGWPVLLRRLTEATASTLPLRRRQIFGTESCWF